MTTTPTVKPTQKALKAYYAALKSYAGHGVENELAVRSAFQNLLDETGRRFGWTLLPEQPETIADKRIQPGGTRGWFLCPLADFGGSISITLCRYQNPFRLENLLICTRAHEVDRMTDRRGKEYSHRFAQISHSRRIGTPLEKV